jgi:FkbM family methyltransferase
MQRIVAGEYLKLALSWRSDNPAELARTFPEMLRTCWMHPAFWLFVVPVRLAPPRLARAVRDCFRQWRERRNRARQPLEMGRSDAGRCLTVNQAVRLHGWFRALVLARRLVAASGTDRLWKAVPLLVPAYRALYAQFRPKETIQAELRGHILYLDLTDLVLTRSLVTMGVWEPFETHLFATAVQAGMVVVDVGANIGHYTLEAARSVGEKGKVFAFEPEPHNFDLLCRNIEANSYQNVTLVQKALSNRCGAARLALSPDNFGGHHLENSPATGGCIEVETLTLDEHFGGRPEKIDVIKMDAEGAEMSILEGMRELLHANPDLILFTEFSPAAIRAAGRDPEKFLKALFASGFCVGIVNHQKTRIEALASRHLGAFVNSLLCEENGKFYVDLLCLRGKAIRGPIGPHEWWQGPAYARAASAGQG